MMKTPEQERIDLLEKAVRDLHAENQRLSVIYYAARRAVTAKSFKRFKFMMNRLAQKIRHYEDRRK